MKALQPCTACLHQGKCWPLHTNKGKPVSTQNILVNILVCRLQRGVDRDKATTNLLQIFRPGMIRLITRAKDTGDIHGVDIDRVLSDMQAVTIEYFVRDYKIGDRGRATPYLFDPKKGFLIKWLKYTINKHKRFYYHHELFDPISFKSGSADAADSDQYSKTLQAVEFLQHDPFNENVDIVSDLIRRVVDIINDGVTLNSNEFRVLKFCMANGNEANGTRHIDGLHIYLSKLMGVSRPRITRLYKRAREKIKREYTEMLLNERVNQ